MLLSILIVTAYLETYLAASLSIFAQLVLLHFLVELHDLLAFGAVTILRSAPVNLLTFDAAVAIGLATLAELASSGIEINSANVTSFSHFAEG